MAGEDRGGRGRDRRALTRGPFRGRFVVYRGTPYADGHVSMRVVGEFPTFSRAIRFVDRLGGLECDTIAIYGTENGWAMSRAYYQRPLPIFSGTTC